MWRKKRVASTLPQAQKTVCSRDRVRPGVVKNWIPGFRLNRVGPGESLDAS